jgi:predicted nucleotidyltransferase
MEKKKLIKNIISLLNSIKFNIMNTIPKNKLTLEEEKLLNGLRKYLDTDLYFYGSIQRADYISGKSDIDIAIFSPNEKSILIKMQHYLHVDNDKFKRVLWRLKKNKTITYGYKLKYEFNNIYLEFAIYNEKAKDDVIEFQDNTINIPFYVGWLLYIIKFLYYQCNLLSLPTFYQLKRRVFAYGTIQGDGNDEEFIVLNNKYNKNNI